MLRRLDPDGVGVAATPYIYLPPIKGIRSPQMVEESISSPLDGKDKTRIQEIVRVLLYYSRVIDSSTVTVVQ